MRWVFCPALFSPPHPRNLRCSWWAESHSTRDVCRGALPEIQCPQPRPLCQIRAAKCSAQTGPAGFSMKNKRLPAPVATALDGRERVHGRPIHFRYWLGHRARPLSKARCYRIDIGGRAVGVPTNIQPHCGPVKSCRAALRGLSLLWGTGIPGAGPFLLKRGQVFEQRADPCRLPQVLMMQQPSVPPVS